MTPKMNRPSKHLHAEIILAMSHCRRVLDRRTTDEYTDSTRFDSGALLPSVYPSFDPSISSAPFTRPRSLARRRRSGWDGWCRGTSTPPARSDRRSLHRISITAKGDDGLLLTILRVC